MGCHGIVTRLEYKDGTLEEQWYSNVAGNAGEDGTASGPVSAAICFHEPKLEETIKSHDDAASSYQWKELCKSIKAVIFRSIHRSHSAYSVAFCAF